MSKENITFRLDSEKRALLDAIAQGQDRDRSYILNQAVEMYLDLYRWQIDEIQTGIREADAGDFAALLYLGMNYVCNMFVSKNQILVET
jgi:predicted transcriptional regulator